MFELLYSVYFGSLFADEEKVKYLTIALSLEEKKVCVSNPEFSHMAYDSQSVPVPSGHQ